MKIEEAIEYFRQCDTVKFILTGVGETEFKTIEFKEFVEALEKQVPKKPNRFAGYTCRECKGRLARQTDLVNQKYCHHCGQAVDWSDENDER